jgi:hypothetical protein
MTKQSFATRFPDAELSWMNEELPIWIRRQLLASDMETMIQGSRAGLTSYVNQELLGQFLPGLHTAGRSRWAQP